MDEKMIEMMANRGESLFTSKMQDLAKKQPSNKDRISLLLELFRSQVSTMELNEENKQNYYAAARMFKACEQIVLDESIEFPDLYDAAVNVYKGLPAQHHIAVTPNTLPQNEIKEKLASNAEIHQHDINLNALDNDEEGNAHHGEVIDLIYDIRPEDLKIEGKRKVGLLPANFDSETDNEDDYTNAEMPEVLEAVVGYDNDDNLLLSCPKCDSTKFVLMSSNAVCLDCDCEFFIPLNIADRLDNTPPIMTPTSEIKGNFNRIDTPQKKNRGLIIELE